MTASKLIWVPKNEYLLKPLELDELTGLVSRALEISRLMKVPAVISEGEPPDDTSDAHLEKMVADGTFRGDLYYRLNVFAITLPPVRQRGENVPLLARHFMNRFSKELAKKVQQQIANSTSNLYADCQALLDHQLFDHVLKHTGGNPTQAAKILGISRATLRSKLVAIGLPFERDAQANSSK